MVDKEECFQTSIWTWKLISLPSQCVQHTPFPSSTWSQWRRLRVCKRSTASSSRAGASSYGGGGGGGGGGVAGTCSRRRPRPPCSPSNCATPLSSSGSLLQLFSIVFIFPEETEMLTRNDRHWSESNGRASSSSCRSTLHVLVRWPGVRALA